MKNEMKKVIPIPDGTERIEVYSYASVDDKGSDYPNGDASFMVDDLPDAPEKRVIELPYDALAEFEALKQSKTLLGLLEAVYDRGLQMAIPLVSDAAKQKIIGEYYSNHAEFVAKKEPRFVVETDSAYVEDYVFLGANVSYLNVHNVGFINDLDDENITDGTFKAYFTESEADKIVADLGGENGLLQARKVKVEE